MEKLKEGFTLAEVLVTMAVIGIVAALTVPGMLANGKYQEVSTRFSKFVATTENAARARAAAEGTIDHEDFEKIILYKTKNVVDMFKTNYVLRDGTSLTITTIGGSSGGLWERTLDAPYNDKARFGKQLALLEFEHKVKGIPNMQTTFDFIITNKGYVIPDPEDECATAIFDNNTTGSWKLTSDMLDKSTGVCYTGQRPPVLVPNPGPRPNPRP